jgi:hypothetical protein
MIQGKEGRVMRAAPDSAIYCLLAAYCVSLVGGIVEDEVSLSVVDDHRHVGTTAPGVCER